MANILDQFINQQFTDVIIILKDEQKEKIFGAHKFIYIQW